jgi:hypothetical protein
MKPEKVSKLTVGNLNESTMGVWKGSVVVARRLQDIEADYLEFLRVLSCKSHVLPSQYIPLNFRLQWQILHQ